MNFIINQFLTHILKFENRSNSNIFTYNWKQDMPKLYEYFGLLILFYSREHEPIHVYCKYQGKESKAEIIFENGKFVEVRISDVMGKEPLDK